ncbi:hypothetical protein L1049_004124 [Liquidambar formosana]|uniref:Uncharacterized protein n=1 Tax=Liquidambar formosana TaxID=63359 RepID=A0AAP0WVE4_LIQFO
MRMLAYGLAVDVVDDYVRIGESTTIESLKKFVKVVIGVFGDEYLRSPNNTNVARLLAEGESCGFPGMLGSNDCVDKIAIGEEPFHLYPSTLFSPLA